MTDIITLTNAVGIGAGTYPLVGNGGAGMNTVASNTINSFNDEDVLDKHAMCKFTVDHKVTEHELMKLKEVAPDYAKEIKENIAKNLAREISHKITYTKKHDKDTDVHHFIGRVWVFTEDELKQILGIRNVY